MAEQQVILMIVGTLFFIGLIFGLVPIILNKIRKKNFVKCDKLTTATVVDYICYHGDTGNTYAPVYSYWVDGVEHKKTSHYSFSGKKFSIGEQVTLRYNSKNSNMIFVDDEQYIVKFVSVIFRIISLVMIVISIAIGIGASIFH